MEDQRDALRKIITTLAVKNEEIQSFIYSLKQMLLNVEANSTKVQEDLVTEFQSLFSLLEEVKESMLMKIKQDRASRTYELQVFRKLDHSLVAIPRGPLQSSALPLHLPATPSAPPPASPISQPFPQAPLSA